jgi:hypothetical protein
MAQACGKQINDYTRTDNKTVQAFLQELSTETGIPVSGVDGLIQSRKGGNNKILQGTWGHPQVAIHCAQWCSAAFAVQVTKWVFNWMNTGQNPLQSDLDRLVYRDTLKNDARLRMTDQVKAHLEAIKKYSNQAYTSGYFARVHDALNKAITGETAKQMRDRLSLQLGRGVKDSELLRDYFPALALQQYISICEVTANLCRQGKDPLQAVKEAANLALPASHFPSPINFSENVKFVRQRVLALSPA